MSDIMSLATVLGSLDPGVRAALAAALLGPATPVVKEEAVVPPVAEVKGGGVEHGRSPSVVSQSWSDMVEEEEAGAAEAVVESMQRASVETSSDGPGVAVPSLPVGKAKSPVSFAEAARGGRPEGLSDVEWGLVLKTRGVVVPSVPAAGVEGVVVPKKAGGFAENVRTHNASQLRAELLVKGIKLPKVAAADVALVTHTAATVPDFFERGREKLRALAVLGDAALTLVLVERAVAVGKDVASAQSARSSLLSDVHLMAVFDKSKLRNFVTYAGGVNPAKSKTGATAFEAIAGLVYKYGGTSAVHTFVLAYGLAARGEMPVYADEDVSSGSGGW